MRKSFKALGLCLVLAMLFVMIAPMAAYAEPDIWATSIKVHKMPKKTEYYYGDKLDTSGLKIYGTFVKSNGEKTTGDITNECYFSANAENLTGEGKEYITVYADLPDKDGYLSEFCTEFAVTVYSCNGPIFKTKSLADGVVGEKYSQTIKVDDNKSGPYTVTEYYNPGKENNFPKGLKLSSNGKITGTPTKAGKFKFWVMLSNNYADEYKEYTIVIKDAAPSATVEPTVAPTPEVTPEVIIATEAPTPIPTEVHEHKADAEWFSDEVNHWHVCECGELMDEAEHDVLVWERIKGTNQETGFCSVCGQLLTRETEEEVGALKNMGLTILIIIGVVVLLIIAAPIVIVIIVVNNKKKKRRNAAQNDAE